MILMLLMRENKHLDNINNKCINKEISNNTITSIINTHNNNITTINSILNSINNTLIIIISNHRNDFIYHISF